MAKAKKDRADLGENPKEDAVNDGEMTVVKAMACFRRAYLHKRSWLQQAREDYEFRLGKQWNDEDVAALREQGRPALTINKIHSNINLLMGMESQGRTDFHAFPEGAEDSVVSEIATCLLKNVVKISGASYKLSDCFDAGVTCGEGWIEPYLDFTNDLLFGEMGFRILDYNQIFPEPGFREYDLSDCSYVDKLSVGMTLEQIVSIFPEREKEIQQMGSASISLDGLGHSDGLGADLQRAGYPDDEESESIDDWKGVRKFDLLEHYYKKMIPVYHVVDREMGQVRETRIKTEADNYKAVAEAESKLRATKNGQLESWETPIKIIERRIPEIWVLSIVGSKEMFHGPAWFSKRWRGFHFIPNFCYRVTIPMRAADRALAVQGIVRQAKSPQEELNKRRSQELHHLNTSISSAIEYEENALVNPNEVRKFGSAPGVHIVRKAGTQPIKKHYPQPLSQGHSQLAGEHAQDLRDIIGIQASMLSMQDSGQESGRLFALRQRQGVVMVQKIFDNQSRTKSIFGRFCLSQLGEVFDIDRALRVLGDSFIRERFSRAKTQQVRTPQGVVDQPVIDPRTGKAVTKVDKALAEAIIRQVLQDASLGKFDVAVGESMSSETVRFGNYQMLLEMAGKGIPVPPDVLVEESTLSQSSKAKIAAAIEKQSALSAGPVERPRAPERKKGGRR